MILRNHSNVFEIASKYCILDSFVDYDGYSISSKGFWPTVVDIIIICILKSRDITLPTKVRLVKAIVFPVIMYGCESCTIKKAERRRIDAFELWC